MPFLSRKEEEACAAESLELKARMKITRLR